MIGLSEIFASTSVSLQRNYFHHMYSAQGMLCSQLQTMSLFLAGLVALRAGLYTVLTGFSLPKSKFVCLVLTSSFSGDFPQGFSYSYHPPHLNNTWFNVQPLFEVYSSVHWMMVLRQFNPVLNCETKWTWTKWCWFKGSSSWSSESPLRKSGI